MDGCSLSDAFPEGSLTSGDCYNRSAGDESRRQERKKSRRCRPDRGASTSSLYPEPDRPAAKRLDPVFAMNESTGLREHNPATAQYPYEPFVGESGGDMADFSAIRKNVTSSTSLPDSSGLPAYFGANPNDSTPLTTQQKRTEGFTSQVAPFVNVIGEDPSYRMYPDFGTAFQSRGADKPTGGLQGPTPSEKIPAFLTPSSMTESDVAPIPNTDIFWKQPNATGGQSAFFSFLNPPSGLPSGPSSMAPQPSSTQVDSAGRREILEKMDRIFARLDDMDKLKNENANTEVLMFILTGLGVIFFMDMSCRIALRK